MTAVTKLKFPIVLSFQVSAGKELSKDEEKFVRLTRNTCDKAQVESKFLEICRNRAVENEKANALLEHDRSAALSEDDKRKKYSQALLTYKNSLIEFRQTYPDLSNIRRNFSSVYQKGSNVDPAIAAIAERNAKYEPYPPNPKHFVAVWAGCVGVLALAGACAGLGQKGKALANMLKWGGGVGAAMAGISAPIITLTWAQADDACLKTQKVNQIMSDYKNDLGFAAHLPQHYIMENDMTAGARILNAQR